MAEKDDNATTTTSKQQQQSNNNSNKIPLFIRQITIVTGRGFYTYCSGPSAPFLKIEYYNPKYRWKIKMLLERGIHLEEWYHPNVTQYDYDLLYTTTTNDDGDGCGYGGTNDIMNGNNDNANNNDDNNNNNSNGDGTIRPLKFRCYEAHIPYTMQVFKNCNLAGLKYVKVGGNSNGCKFRTPLPKGLRKRTRDEFISSYNDNGGGGEGRSNSNNNNSSSNNSSSGGDKRSSSGSHQSLDDNAFFLSHTVPPELLWPMSNDLTTTAQTRQQQSDNNTSKATTERNDQWTKKQTSCDIEFDCTIQNILNVHDVITQLPTRFEERQCMHWRAVPSLREIWEQERKRMSLLLPPENDFLSFKDDDDDDDDESSSSSSSDEEEEEESIIRQRNNKDVPQFTLNVKKGASRSGTKLAIKGVQRLFQTSLGLEDDFHRALKDVAVRHEAFIDRVDATIMRDGVLTKYATSSDNNNVTTMNNFAIQCDSKEEQEEDYTPNVDEGIEALAALGGQFSQGSSGLASDDYTNCHRNLSQSSTTSSAHVGSKLLAITKKHDAAAAPLSQYEVDEEIEMLEFGNKVDNGEYVQFNNNSRETAAGTDQLDPTLGPYGMDEADEYEDDDNFLIEEERMGEKGLEKALTQLATQAMEPNEEFSNIEVGDSMEELNFEMNYHDDTHHDMPAEEDDRDDLFSDDESQPDEEHTLPNNLSQPSEDSAPNDHDDDDVGRFIVEGYSSTPQSEESACGGLSQKHMLELPTSDFVVEPYQSSTLRRGEIIKSGEKSWHSLPSALQETCPPPWFKFQWKSSGAPPVVYNGSFLEPVKRPPSYSQVKSWIKVRSRKRSSLPQDTTNKTAKQQKVASDHYSKDKSDNNESQGSAYLTAFTQYSQLEDSQENNTPDPLAGLGQQGCKVQVSSGGGLKTEINTSTTFTPLTMMSIEVHVQCRIRTGSKDQKEIAMVPDSSRDAVFAVVYVYGRDPGGGESIEILEKGCVLVTILPKGQSANSRSVPNNVSKATGVSSDVKVERVNSERSLLLRIASIVQLKDPDAIVSWDTQGGGIGYMIERGIALGKPPDGNNGVNNPSSSQIDLARLLGRTPRATSSLDDSTNVSTKENSFGIEDDQQKIEKGHEWSGSGLGSEWDDRVGAGAAASSIVGRIVMCGWKICSEECKHPNASYQPAIVSAVLNKRIPFHDDLLLTKWYSTSREQWRVVEYRLAQAMSTVLLFDALDVIGRAGEAARLSGVEFSQSLPGIRGSQYKVEGVLLRALQSVQSNERGEKKGLNREAGLFGSSLTSSNDSQTQSQSPWKLRRNKSSNTHTSADASTGLKNASRINSKDLGYFFYSPSKIDCSNQEALECQAMTLEPKSGFHFDPVVVCDFTALYPSLVIAYNLCYTTVAGKLNYHSTRKEMRTSGRTTMKCGPFFYSERRSAAVVKHHMKSLLVSDEANDQTSKRRKRDRAYAIPTGSIFVSESVLKGVLPQVLDEMLSTRAMLKKAAKEYKKRVTNLSPAVLRQIEARQLALKYVANVTYGYTSATFSGRSAVPLVADAIVECGRRTLTNAIDLANKWGRVENGKWYGAHVLYGDTDSVFIKLPGRSVKEAFAFGEEYCNAVTASNPPPIQLKLEKVYSASLLQTKKKYCGMMYESPTQKRPTFEAKGIETVRRDQCTITQRVLKNALITAFQRGIGPLRDYLHRQWALIHSGNLPVSDFILTGRVRSRYRGGRVGPVQASLAKRLAEIDPGRVVRHKERLPYVIVAMPGKVFKLKDGVLTPLELLEQWDSYAINAEYYTVRHVNAALQRCFGLPPFNVNIHAWYNSCPKPRKRIHHWPQSRSASSLMISSYFGSDTCAFCSSKCKSVGRSKVVVCQKCKADSITVACTAIDRLRQTQQQANYLADVCTDCNGCLETSKTFAQEEMQQSTKRRENSRGVVNLTSRRAAVRLSTPLASCVCIDCPVTYKRHRIRELEIEAMELCQALDLG